MGMKFIENCSQWQGFILEQFAKGCLPWERLRVGAGEEYQEEEAAKSTLNELTMNPIFCCPVLLDEREVKKIVSEVKYKRKEEWEENALKFVFTSHFPALTFDWQLIKPIFPGQMFCPCQ